MPDEDIVNLMRRSGLSFIGTVQRLSAATMTDIPVDDHTAVVRVDQVLHAPDAFTALAGQSVTVQLDPNAPVPAVGESVVLFADVTALGDTVVTSEVGRVPVDDIAPHVAPEALMAGQAPLADFAAQAAAADLRAHADDADAIVIARVTALAKAGESVTAVEHDPDFWQATLDVEHAEKGDVQAGPLTVLYANSLDVRWRAAPKPKAGQEAMWLLHATEGDLRQLAPYQILHPDDVQPVHLLESLRPAGG
jgi:hypothetical protein